MNKADVLRELYELTRVHRDQQMVLQLASVVIGTLDADRVRKLLRLVQTNGYATVRNRPSKQRRLR